MKDNIYRFYKYNNNPNGSDYCFCQRPVDSNMSLCCFFENGEICGFMSETLVPGHSEIKEIDMNKFMYDFVRPIIKENMELKEIIKKKDEEIDELREKLTGYAFRYIEGVNIFSEKEVDEMIKKMKEGR